MKKSPHQTTPLTQESTCAKTLKAQKNKHPKPEKQPPRNQNQAPPHTAQQSPQSQQGTVVKITTSFRQLFTYLKSLHPAWPITWLIIYLSFNILGLFWPSSIIVSAFKLSGIALCVFFATRHFPHDPLLTIALAFTLLSDIILQLQNTSIFGVFVFCFVQFFHIARLSQTSPKFFLAYYAAVIAIFFFGVTQEIPAMYSIAFVYGMSLLVNFLLARHWYRATHTTASFCALLGFALFILCDICVGTSYLSVTGVIPAVFYGFANYFAWLFYYPSQILISNSSKTMLQ